MKRNFWRMIKYQWRRGKFVCVGLDSDHNELPECMRAPKDQPELIGWSLFCFNKAIIEATCDLVCAYKLNSAFYETHGRPGIYALERTIAYIKERAPTIPIILDAKRADTDNSSARYADATFLVLGADAVTVNPYLGKKALEPFLAQKEKGIFVLCRTSNEGADEFQDLKVGRKRLYQLVAQHVAEHWNQNNNCGLVVAATEPGKLAIVRRVAGDMPILVPGIGAQNGDIEKVLVAGINNRGQGLIISASRSIIFASRGDDFAKAARRHTQRLHRQINAYLKQL